MLSYFSFVTGIALLMLGIHSLRQGSERFFGARLRQLLQSATSNRRRSVLAGLLISILMPSSTAVTVLAVEGINAGYMEFSHVLALMLGANIGFTVTVQLLAFRFYVYNAIFFAIGVPIYLFSKRVNIRGAGQAVLGIGLLLLALQMLSAGTAPLKQSAAVADIMRMLSNHPVVLLLFAMVLEMALQSATAAIGIALALCAEGILPVDGALAVVLGANLGIAVTTLIAGFANVDTRRMAWGNLLFVLAGVVVCVPLVPELAALLRVVSPAGDAQVIANAHTLFNVALAVVFLPLVPLVARLLERLVQARKPGEGKFGPRYLDPSSLSSPALALGQASREILRMADIVQEMLRNAHRAFQENNPALCDETQQMDDKVDLLSGAIKTYITRLSEQALTAPESQREMAVLSFCIELECIGDIIDKNLIDAAKKKLSLQVAFSKDGWAELDHFFQEVIGNFQVAVAAFTNRDAELAETLLRNKQKIDDEELELRNRHFHRLHEGLAESIETSAIHLDVLAYLRAINSHLTSVAHPILDNKPS